MASTKHSKDSIQLIWGTALFFMGIAVFFRLPQVVPKMAAMGLSDFTIGFFRICLYLIGFVLVGGGVKKWIQYFNSAKASSGHTRSDNDDERSG